MLQRDVRLCQLDPSLERSDLDVGQPNLGDQGDQHVVIVRDRGQQRRVFGVDVAAELAPEIKLPRRIKAQTRSLEAVEWRVVAVDPDTAVARVDSLLLREKLTDRDAANSPGLDHAQAGRTQREVLLVRLMDQSVQHRVFEHGPPFADLRGLLCKRRRGLEPCWVNVRLRAYIVRAHRASGQGGGRNRDQNPVGG